MRHVGRPGRRPSRLAAWALAAGMILAGLALPADAARRPAPAQMPTPPFPTLEPTVPLPTLPPNVPTPSLFTATATARVTPTGGTATPMPASPTPATEPTATPLFGLRFQAYMPWAVSGYELVEPSLR